MVALRGPEAAGWTGAEPLGATGRPEPLLALLPYVFLVVAFLGSVVVAMTTPPFMGPDEPNHTYRAYLLTLGQPIAGKVEVGDGLRGGGPADRGAIAAAAVFEPLKFNPDRKAEPGEMAAARAIPWTGSKAPTDFQNTAIYGPAFYVPQALGLALGRTLRFGVVDSLRLARIAGALACALVGFLALKIAGRARIALFAVLTLPMASFLYATLTQDGLILTVTALGCALLSRAMTEDRSLTVGELWGAALCFALVAMGKPPLALFGLMLLAARFDGPGPRWAAAWFPLVTGALWSAAMSLLVWVTDGTEARQAAWLAGHTLAIPALAARTLAAHGPMLAEQFVGVLGWLDTPLPGPYRLAAWTVLGLAAALAWGRSRPSGWRGLAPTAAAVALVVVDAIFLTLYLQWTPLGAPVVEGVQGRYFLPVAAVAALALEGRPASGLRGVRTVLLAVVALFPLISFWVADHALVLRYFGP
jgi:hypothetical protein